MATRTSNTHAHVRGAVETTYGDKTGLTLGFNWPLEPGSGFRRMRDRLPNDGLPGVGGNSSVGVRQRAEGTLPGRMDYDTVGFILRMLTGNVETDVITSGALYANFLFPQVDKPSAYFQQLLADVDGDVVGSVCTSWGLEMGNDEPLRFNSTWLSKDFDAFAEIPATPGGDQPVYDDSVHAAEIKPSQMTSMTIGAVTLASSSVNLVRNMTMGVDESMPGDDYGFGVSARSKPVRRGKMSVDLSLDLITWEDAFWKVSDSTGVLATFIADGSTQAVTMTWNNGLSGSSEREFILYFPACVVTGEMPDATNAGALPATLTLLPENGTIAAGTFTSGGGSNAQVTNVPFGMALLNNEDVSAL